LIRGAYRGSGRDGTGSSRFCPEAGVITNRLECSKLSWQRQFEYNWFSQARYKITSSQSLPEGQATIRVEFLSDGGVGKGGKVELYVNDKKVGTGRVDKTVPGRFSADETFDIGMDTGSPVSTDYRSPNAFTGKITKVTFDLGPVAPG